MIGRHLIKKSVYLYALPMKKIRGAYEDFTLEANKSQQPIAQMWLIRGSII